MAQNPTSSAGGVFQFVDSTWEHYSNIYGFTGNKKDADDNIWLATKVLADYGTEDWEADPKSERCWRYEMSLIFEVNIANI